MKRSRSRIKATLLQQLPLILFFVVFIIFGLLSPRFLELQSFENIVKQASYIGIVAVGMTLVLLTAGIDLSVGSNMYVSAALAGLLMHTYHLSLGVALLACLSIGLLFGLVNAFCITKLHIIPFITTLGTLVAGRGVGQLLTGSRAVPFPDSVLQIGSIRFLGFIPLPILIFTVVVVLAHLFLKRIPLGRQIYAVGGDPDAAQKAGIPTNRVLVTVYVLCGLLAALGGFVSVAQLGIVNAGFGEGDEFDAIAAAVLGGASLFGGRGTVFPGTVLGAVLIQMIAAGLVFTQVDLYLQPLVIATIIFIAVWLDSARTTYLTRLRRRTIRIEEQH